VDFRAIWIMGRLAAWCSG